MEAAFEDIRQTIDECPKLWFLDDHSPITLQTDAKLWFLDDHSPIILQTDASNYGIGAYLYQFVPPNEREAVLCEEEKSNDDMSVDNND